MSPSQQACREDWSAGGGTMSEPVDPGTPPRPIEPRDEVRPPWSRSDRLVPRSVLRPLQEFLETSIASASLLFGAVIVALIWANSPWNASYEALFEYAVPGPARFPGRPRPGPALLGERRPDDPVLPRRGARDQARGGLGRAPRRSRGHLADPRGSGRHARSRSALRGDRGGQRGEPRLGDPHGHRHRVRARDPGPRRRACLPEPEAAAADARDRRRHRRDRRDRRVLHGGHRTGRPVRGGRRRRGHRARERVCTSAS